MWRAVPALLVPLSAGWLVLSAAWPGARPDWPHRLLKAGLAVALGSGLSAVAAFLVVLVGGLSLPAVVLADLALASAAVLAWRHGRSRALQRPDDPPPSRRVPDDQWSVRLLVAAVSVTALGAAATFTAQTARFPHGMWDAWAIWNLRARFLFRGADRWRDGLSPLIGWSHPDYPLLLPLTVARGWMYVGGEGVAIPIAGAALFTVAGVAVAGSGVTVLGGPARGLLAALLLLGTPAFAVRGALQEADIPLALLLLSTVVLIAIRERQRGRAGRLGALAGLTIGLAAWAKTEGLLMLVASLVAYLGATRRVIGRRASIRHVAPLVLGAAPAFFLALLHRVWLAPPSEYLTQSVTSLATRVADPGRYVTIARAFLVGVLDLGGWIVGIVGVMALLYLVLGAHLAAENRVALRTGLGVLGLTLGGYFAAYLISPYDLRWHLGTSLSRLLLQLWPTAVFVFALTVGGFPEDGPAPPAPQDARGSRPAARG